MHEGRTAESLRRLKVVPTKSMLEFLLSILNQFSKLARVDHRYLELVPKEVKPKRVFWFSLGWHHDKDSWTVPAVSPTTFLSKTVLTRRGYIQGADRVNTVSFVSNGVRVHFVRFTAQKHLIAIGSVRLFSDVSYFNRDNNNIQGR